MEWIWASLKERCIALHLICALYGIKRDVQPIIRALQCRDVTRIDLRETGMAPHMRTIRVAKKRMLHEKRPTVQRY